MKSTTLSPLDFSHPLPRASVVSLLYSALRLKEYRFTRQAALSWLAVFPGDLEVNLILAQAMYGEERFSQIASVVEDLVLKDPEFMGAQQLRSMPQVTKNQDTRLSAFASLHALNGSVKQNVSIPEWASQTWSARQALSTGDTATAERLIHDALVSEPGSPLPAILHLQLTKATQDHNATHTLAEVYHARWPDCIQFKLFLAEALLQDSDEAGSVSLLHQCAALDAAGQVPTRLWGKDNPYRTLWPAQLEILFDLPVPAPLASAMGWNQLASGPVAPPVISTGEQKSAPKEVAAPTHLPPDLLQQIQQEFERLGRRLRHPGVGQADGRYPVYVVFSCRKALETFYGPQSASVIEAEMKNLAASVRKRANWGAMHYLPDDPSCTSPMGITPVIGNDPWKLKLSLHDLDAALSKKGQMIGAVMIVGGPEIIPFHRLPNPTSDADAEVSSDNPYASLDQNYFIPDWSVGRLPGGSAADAGLLLGSLRRLIAYHDKYARPASWANLGRIFQALFRNLKKTLPKKIQGKSSNPGFGFSASVWKGSSQAVFRTIGDPQTLLTCPPVAASQIMLNRLATARLDYFNLHGLIDGADWYGQRDITDNSGGPDYPVALSPKDIPQTGKDTRIVFTEACYGAHIDDRNEDYSIALKFMSNGCLAFVGSTCVSYGSVTTPLIAADLLAYFFWKAVKEGKSVGEAFVQAKVSLVDEMGKRQGYLDGEDQKTLISFVLYGDPLVIVDESVSKAKAFTRLQQHPVVKVICDSENEEEGEVLPEAMLTRVKGLVNQYLPGLQGADFTIRSQRPIFDEEGRPFASPQMGSKSRGSKQQPKHTVIRLSKQVEFARHIHHHYARFTLDNKGKVVKMSLSR